MELETFDNLAKRLLKKKRKKNLVREKKHS